MHDPCDKPFQLAPCRDLDLWPTSRSKLLPVGGSQLSKVACWICNIWSHDIVWHFGFLCCLYSLLYKCICKHTKPKLHTIPHYNVYSNYWHVLKQFRQVLTSFQGLFLCTWRLFNNQVSGIYVEIEFLDGVFNYGQVCSTMEYCKTHYI